MYVLTVTAEYQMDETIFAQAIQGITAREKPQIHINYFDRPSYTTWLAETQKKYGFETVHVSGIWELAEIFKDYLKGYVAYPAFGTEAMNYAATLAGVLDAVPVTPRLRAEAERRGLQQLDNAADYTDISMIIHKYGSQLNKKIYLNQNVHDIALRDFGIKHRCITVYEYQPGLQPVYAFMDPNAIMFGWGRDGEVEGVRCATEQRIISLASDHALNLSFYEEVSNDVIPQQHELIDKDLQAQPGKHYVSFSYSDGDNIQWILNGLPLDATRWAIPERTIPLGWPLTPLLPDLAPIVLEYLYKTARPTDNVFCAGCGYGYIFASMYDRDNLLEYGEWTAESMRRSDMQYFELYDEFFDGETKPEVFEAFLRHPNIKGILYRTGSYYADGRGFLKCVNGKPVVSYRDALWNVPHTIKNMPENEKKKDIYELAYRISQYPKDYTKIDGYTMVMVHAWSHLYDSIQKTADWLKENDPDVVIVTPSTLMRLVEENVPKVNAYPAKHKFITWEYPPGVTQLYS